jgi:hypothetical protein
MKDSANYKRKLGDRHCLNHLMHVMDLLGGIANSVQVNNHVFNAVSQEDMRRKVEMTKQALDRFAEAYDRDHENVPNELQF